MSSDKNDHLTFLSFNNIDSLKLSDQMNKKDFKFISWPLQEGSYKKKANPRDPSLIEPLLFHLVKLTQ